MLSPKLKTRGSSEIIVLDERDMWPTLLLDALELDMPSSLEAVPQQGREM